MLCIFCLKDRPPSEEHVFPEAIGGILTIDRVCLTCNNLLNERADRGLIQYPTVKVLRAQKGIPDKRGNTLDPFSDIFGTGTIIDDERTGQRVVARLDPLTNKRTLKLIPHRTEKVGPDGSKEFEYKIDAGDEDKIPLIIQRERKRLGRPELSPSALDDAVSKVLARSRRVIENPLVYHQMALRFTDPRRGILKIAYELAWYWLGDDYLDDEGAQQLRQVILSNEPIDDPRLPKIRGITSAGEVVPGLVLWNHVPNVHLGLMKHFKNQVGVGIRVFQALSAVVGVSEESARYGRLGERNFLGSFMKLDPVSRTFTESSLSDAVLDLCSDSRTRRA